LCFFAKGGNIVLVSKFLQKGPQVLRFFLFGLKTMTCTVPISISSGVTFPQRGYRFLLGNTEDDFRVAQFASENNHCIGSCLAEESASGFKDIGTLLRLCQVTDEGVFVEPLARFRVTNRKIVPHVDVDRNAWGAFNVAEVELLPWETSGNYDGVVEKMITLIDYFAERDERLEELLWGSRNEDAEGFTWIVANKLLGRPDGKYIFLQLDLPSRLKALCLLLSQVTRPLHHQYAHL